MFAVIMHKGGGIGCEILCKKSKMPATLQTFS